MRAEWRFASKRSALQSNFAVHLHVKVAAGIVQLAGIAAPTARLRFPRDSVGAFTSLLQEVAMTRADMGA